MILYLNLNPKQSWRGNTVMVQPKPKWCIQKLQTWQHATSSWVHSALQSCPSQFSSRLMWALTLQVENTLKCTIFPRTSTKFPIPGDREELSFFLEAAERACWWRLKLTLFLLQFVLFNLLLIIISLQSYTPFNKFVSPISIRFFSLFLLPLFAWGEEGVLRD